MPEAVPLLAIRTPRLVLRPPQTSDADVVLGLHRDPRALAHNPGDALADLEAAHELLGRWRSHWAQHGRGYWALSWHQDPAVLGFCGAKVMNLHARPVWNLFYRLDPRAWGRGVASEAATAVVQDVLAREPKRPVIARVRPANHASAAVAVNAGLHRMAELDSPGEDGLDHIYVAPGWSTA